MQEEKVHLDRHKSGIYSQVVRPNGTSSYINSPSSYNSMQISVLYST